MDKTETTLKIMRVAPVIPVIVIDDARKAIGLARALVAGGLPAIEITLRTPKAIDCIRAVASEVEGAIAGAGTVLDAAQIDAVTRAGAKFMVSPGAAPKLIAAAGDSAVPLLPGAATASEMMALGEAGYRCLKFFPAEASGGAAALKAITQPLPQFSICPTGGITPEKARDYLAISQVECVGGSWVAPAKLVEAEDWVAIEALAREAAGMAA